MSLSVKAMVAAALGAVLLGVATFVAALVRPELVMPLSFAAVVAFGIAVTESLLAALQAKELFGRMLVLGLLTAALRLVPVVTLAVLGALTLPSALLLFVAAAYLSCGLSAIVAWRTLRGPFELDPTLAGEMFAFSRWLVLATIFGAATMSLDLLVLSQVRGPQETGIYAAARTLALPFAVATAAIAAVLLPRLSRIAAHAPIAPHIWRYGRPIALIATAVALLLVVLAPELVRLAYGDPFQSAASVFQVLVAVHWLEIISMPIVTALMVSDRPDIIAKTNLVMLCFSASALAVLVPRFGGLGAAAALLLARALAQILYVLVLRGAPFALGRSRPPA